MMTDRQISGEKVTPAIMIRQYGGRAGRCGVEEKIRLLPVPRHRRFAKSLRHAATEFVSAKKKWSTGFGRSTVVQDLEKEFNALSKQWRDETAFQSSLSAICLHPAYQTIMAMGKEAVPFILRDLEKQFGHWFYALKHIAREDMARDATNLEDARQRWLAWGKNKIP